MKKLRTKPKSTGPRTLEKEKTMPRAAKRVLQADILSQSAAKGLSLRPGQTDAEQNENTPEGGAATQVESAAQRGVYYAEITGRETVKTAKTVYRYYTARREAKRAEREKETEPPPKATPHTNNANPTGPDTTIPVSSNQASPEVQARGGQSPVLAHSNQSKELKTRTMLQNAGKAGQQKAARYQARRPIGASFSSSAGTPIAGSSNWRAPLSSGRAAARQSAAREFTRQALQQAAQTAKTVRNAMVQVAHALTRAITAAISWLSAALAAASPVIVLVLIVGMVGTFLASPFGVFFSNEQSKDGELMRQATAQLNEEYYARIAQISQDNPHDILETKASDDVMAIRWEDVLSVYAVKVTTDDANGMDVVTMDATKKEILRGILWDMNEITYDSHTVMKEVEVIVEDEDGNERTEIRQIPETTLTIYLHHKAPEEMAAAYGFTAQQNEHLALLRHEEYSAMWATLLGGLTHGGGIMDSEADWTGTNIFAWPLPQSFSITSRFGYRSDPFTGQISYHSGTDIAAPYGTPILASASGTVTVANATDPWGGSYGYYVKITHNSTYDTLYAHCSSICVTPGQQVQQGEVIGYVGSTGNSTGNHLHFEVWSNGQRTDALSYFQ